MRAGIASPDPGLCAQPVLPRLPGGPDAGAGIRPGANERGAGPASGWWFLAFAADADPGRRGAGQDRPAAHHDRLLAVGALGAALFATASDTGHITLAMALIGVGCSPVLMASYYIFARHLFSPAVFGTLAAMTIGIGSPGQYRRLAAADDRGRGLWLARHGLGAGRDHAAGALAVYAPWCAIRRRRRRGPRAVVLTLLRMPALWPILSDDGSSAMPRPRALRGPVAGPVFQGCLGLDAARRSGWHGLWMGLAMVAGSFRLWAAGSLVGHPEMGGLWRQCGDAGLSGRALGGQWARSTVGCSPCCFVAGVGFFGATFPIVIGHARAFFPPHLMGRGVTLVNLFGIASVGLAQAGDRPPACRHAGGDGPRRALCRRLRLFRHRAGAWPCAPIFCHSDRTD
jgi:hypothetical protein